MLTIDPKEALAPSALCAKTEAANVPAKNENGLPDAKVYGGKGAALLEMASLGLPVPEALVLTTDAWHAYRTSGELPNAVIEAVEAFVTVEHPTAMFSVRSGAPISMPGMMDTVLNVGVTPELDVSYPGAYRRFVFAWLEIVKGHPSARVAELSKLVYGRMVLKNKDTDFAYERKLLQAVVQGVESISVPQGRVEQALACVRAVFDSWDTPRAKAYREMHGISEDMGTGCVIQRMVMGTAPGFSGSGVMFSRNPATGENEVTGELAFNAQGEEVVNGSVTPVDLQTLRLGNTKEQKLFVELTELAIKLEEERGDVQDIEFTVETGSLYVLQTRTAKMSARARIVTAVELASEKFKSKTMQLDYVRERVSRSLVEKTRVASVADQGKAISSGLPASPGAFTGKVVFRSTPLSKVDKGCILVAEDTAPEDFPIMAKCGAILTKTGGFTCHSAVVARGIGVPAVVGCEKLTFSTNGAQFAFASMKTAGAFSEGSVITVDGGSGRVFSGAEKVTPGAVPVKLMHFLDSVIKSKYKPEQLQEVWYLNTDIGTRVAFPIYPSDPERSLESINVAQDLMMIVGQKVAFYFVMEGFGQDLFSAPVSTALDKLAEAVGNNLSGATVLFGLPPELYATAESKLGMNISLAAASLLDLLDLLEA